MPYGILKCDTITFTDGGVDKSVSISGLVQNPTFSGNITVTGTVSGNTIQGQTVSGVTVTGTTSNFASGVFTTQISGATVTGNVGSFTTITGGTVTLTSGVFGAGTASAPSISFSSDPNTGIYSPGADQVAISTNGAGRLFVDAGGAVGVNTNTSSIQSIGRLVVQNASTTAEERFIVAANAYLSGPTFTGTYIQQGDTATTGTSFGLSRTNLGSLIFQNTSAGLIGCNSGVPLVFGTSGQERLRITSAGLVGIGTSAPGAPLDTRGFATYRGNVYTIASFCANNTNVPLNIVQGIDGTHPSISAGQNSTGTWGALGFVTSEQYRMLITSAGNVGIGNTAPAEALTVEGKIWVGNTNAEPSSTSDRGDITITNDTGPADILFLDRGLAATRIGVDTGDSGNFKFVTDKEFVWRTGGTSYSAFNTGTERARIDSSGRLLVGTSTNTDSNLVQVFNNGVGITSFSADQYAYGNLVFTKSRGTTAGSKTIVASGDELGGLYFQGADGANYRYGAAITASVDGTPGANDMPGRLVFSTTADGASSPTERMRITNDGTIWLGANAISQSTGTVDGGTFYSSGVLGLSANGDRPLFLKRRTSDGFILTFNRDSTQVGNISVTTTATSYVTTSDYRLKENVTPVSDGITRLQQLKPSRFNFIADPDKTVDGFLAHEVQTIVPEAITGEKDAVDEDGNPIYQGIDQSKLVPLLTAALQEAIGEIESLKTRLTAAGI